MTFRGINFYFWPVFVNFWILIKAYILYNIYYTSCNEDFCTDEILGLLRNNLLMKADVLRVQNRYQKKSTKSYRQPAGILHKRIMSDIAFITKYWKIANLLKRLILFTRRAQGKQTWSLPVTVYRWKNSVTLANFCFL